MQHQISDIKIFRSSGMSWACSDWSASKGHDDSSLYESRLMQLLQNMAVAGNQEDKLLIFLEYCAHTITPMDMTAVIKALRCR